MRGSFEDQGQIFSYMTLEERVPENHPLRRVRALVRDVLLAMDRDFHKLYAREGRRSAIDTRTTRHAGYGISQTKRKMIECVFGWGKLNGTMRKTKFRGTQNVAGHFMLNLIGYNLIRIPKLLAATG
jgi:hypothetical protein